MFCPSANLAFTWIWKVFQKLGNQFLIEQLDILYSQTGTFRWELTARMRELGGEL